MSKKQKNEHSSLNRTQTQEINAKNKSARNAKIRKGIYYTCICIFIGATIYMVVDIINVHKQTMDWDKHEDALPMAELPPDVLNDTGDIPEKKAEFIKAYNNVITKKGDLDNNPDKLVIVEETFKEIPDTAPGYELYKVKYDEVQQKISIQNDINNLFSSDTTLKSNVTPTTIAELSNNVYPKLNALYKVNQEDIFVIRYNNILKTLNNDATMVDQLLGNYATQVMITGSSKSPKITLEPTLTMQDFNSLQASLDNTNYKWPYVTVLRTIDDIINKPLDKQTKQIMAYKSYLNDIEAKEKAYKDLENEHKLREKEYQNALLERQQEKQARARQEAEDKRNSQRETTTTTSSSTTTTSSSSTSDTTETTTSETEEDYGIEVPNFTNKPLEEAQAWFIDQGIMIATQAIESEQPSGTVISIQGLNNVNNVDYVTPTSNVIVTISK